MTLEEEQLSKARERLEDLKIAARMLLDAVRDEKAAEALAFARWLDLHALIEDAEGRHG